MPTNIARQFADIVKEQNTYTTQRQAMVPLLDQARQESKKAIFLLLKGKENDAGIALNHAMNMLNKVETMIGTVPLLREHGTYRGAWEEYLEASFLQAILNNSSTQSILEQTTVPPEIVLGALADCTGELVRFAILQATAGELGKVQEARNIVEDVAVLCSEITVTSGGYLRSKLDQIDKNLRKLEEMLYTARYSG